MKHNVVQMKKVSLKSARLGQPDLPKDTERFSSSKALTQPQTSDFQPQTADLGRSVRRSSEPFMLPSRTMPMRQIPTVSAMTLHSVRPSFWDKVKFKVER